MMTTEQRQAIIAAWRPSDVELCLDGLLKSRKSSERVEVIDAWIDLLRARLAK